LKLHTLGAALDSQLARFAAKRCSGMAHQALPTRLLPTRAGLIRCFDSASAATHAALPCVIFVPDGPNVIEHYADLIALLLSNASPNSAPRLRVVCFDMPGFGHSLPQASYTHSLDQGAQAVLDVMDALHISHSSLAFSCANGFYALRAAQLAPQRITQLVLSQTPSLVDMRAWVGRMIVWPLRQPVLGQLLAWLFRRKAALGWYRVALSKANASEQTAPFQDKARYALACGGCFCLAGVVQGLMREPTAGLRGVATPCTLVWGAQDRSHKPTKAQSLQALVPHAKVVTFDDCGHFPDVEQPKRYAALLLRLLAETPASSP
jgi:pimeloyl-ACP methyl ester carboxylesterase